MAFKSVWGFNPEELLRAHSMSFLLGTPVARVLGRAHPELFGRIAGNWDLIHILATGWDNSPFSASHERAKANGWKTRTVACGHDVMLDRPDELTELLLGYVP